MLNNIFEFKEACSDEELIETILSNKNLTVNKIISPHAPNGFETIYIQDDNELVFLIQGVAHIDMQSKTIKLQKGDYLYIPKNEKHRISFTSKEPLAIWLCIHF